MEDEWIQWLKPAVLIAKEAGAGIMNYYGVPTDRLSVTRKDDNTLLTEADVQAHEIIHNGLQQLTPDIPILSEEGLIPGYPQRSQWSHYWLLDPLDGTRGFVDRRDEFTVNIALIEHRRPVMGVIYAPVLKQCYFALQGEGAFRQELDDEPQSIHTNTMNWEAFYVLLGHYLQTARLPGLFHDVAGCHVVRVNSSLKFCRIAEGKGDIYPRLGDTSEWDTAAAQCILTEAGGAIVDLQGEALQYNAKESLLNPPFVAFGDPTQSKKIIELIHQKRREK
ncbi:MAG TPA: 3'(2'),5'-bisphosphate nucleotidase [Methylococcales bacterium]|nr:3'(2'),5'-bisphosphate nucleotidase [Methylococcales bacterium]